MPDLNPAFQEFVNVLTVAAGAHAFAIAGIRQMHGYWTHRLEIAEPPMTSSSTVFITTDDPRLAETTVLSKWRLGDLPVLLSEGGSVMTTVSQQWAVGIYSEWEEHYRARITETVGAAEPIKIPVLGDLRRFRNDIVHHRGIATNHNTGGCEVLSHWFQPGDRLYFDTAKVAEFMGHLQVTEKVSTDGWGSADLIRRPPAD